MTTVTSAQQVDIWEQQLTTQGWSGWTPWQRDILQHWDNEQSWIAYFPVGGGVGHTYLLPALTQPTTATLAICGSQERAARREQQAQDLGLSLVRPQPGTPLPTLEKGLLLLTESEAVAHAEELADWSKEHLGRVILDGPTPSKEPPAWWPPISSRPVGIFPQHASPESWWHRALKEEDNTPQTLHYDHHALSVSWDLRPENFVETLKQQIEEGVQFFWVLGGRILRTLLHDVDDVQLQIHDASSEQPSPEERTSSSQHTHATLYLIPHALHAPLSLPSADTVLLSRLPSNFRELGALRNQLPNKILIPTFETSTQPQDAHHAPLQDFLKQRQDPSTQGTLYVTSVELMEAMGLPFAPQPKYERSLKSLEQSLQTLQSQGDLTRWTPVFFQVKLFSAQRLQEAAVQDEPELLAFYQAYTGLQERLSPLDALQLGLHDGRTLDLRRLAQELPYTVAQLNTLFALLNEKDLLVCELQHIPGPHHPKDHEYQLELGEIIPTHRALQLWAQSGPHRETLLTHSLDRTPQPEDSWLSNVWSQDPAQPTFWQEVLPLLAQARQNERLQHLGGRILQRLDREETHAGFALWMSVAAQLDLPSLPAQETRNYLPPARKAPEGMFALCKQIMKSYGEPPPRAWLDAVLAMPGAEEDPEMIELFVQRSASRVLGLQKVGRFRWLVKRYHQSMVALAQKHLALDPDEATSTAEALQETRPPATDTNETASDTPQKKNPKTPALHLPVLQDEQRETLAKLIGDKAMAAWGWSLHLQGLHEEALPLLRIGRDLDAQLQQRYASVALQLPKQIYRENSAWLRWLLEEGGGNKDPKLQRRLLKILVDRKEYTPEEQAQVATWAEEDGDIKRAVRLRKQMLEDAPEDPLQHEALSRLYLQQKKLKDALQHAIQANRLNPRKHPLEIFLKQAHEALFADLQQLRAMLVDLPAHPALSAIEADLSQREELAQKLAPTLQDVEAKVQQGKLSEARERCQVVIQEHQDLTPVRFLQIKRDIDKQERELQRKLQRATKGRGRRDPRAQNREIEALVQQATEAGFISMALHGLRQLLKRNRQFGLAWVKLARLTPHQKERDQAYAAALDLTKGPDQRRKNLEEWSRSLDKEGRLDVLLPALLKLLNQHHEEARNFEPILIKLISKYGIKPDVAETLEGFLKDNRTDLKLQRAERALQDIDHLDPWKRKLLSMQAEIAQKDDKKKKKRPRQKTEQSATKDTNKRPPRSRSRRNPKTDDKETPASRPDKPSNP